MSKLEKLIAEFCPKGVEYKTLGNDDYVEIANTARQPVKASSRIPGKIPYYGANNIQDYVDGYTHDGTFVLIAEDGSASLKNYSIQWAAGKFWANNHVHVLRGIGTLNSRFLYYCLHTVNFIPFLSGGSRAKLTKAKLIEIPIPIPCPENPEKSLEIQREIVRILDNFTELSAELSAELKARKKQYEYYRDQLLTFGDDVPMVSLGDTCVPTRNIRWAETDDYYKYIDLTSVSRDTHVIVETTTINNENAPSRAQKVVEKNDVIFATTRPTLRRFALIDDEFAGQICSTGFCVLRANTKKILPKWIYYQISQSSYYDYMESVQKGSAYPAVSDAEVKRYKIHLPSIGEQQRIITLLDQFETLTTDITSGLPAEIAARQKQYEYYRDKLLTFEVAK